MAKRSHAYRRTFHEIEKDMLADYDAMVKFPSKVNPIFLQKPYSACKSNLRHDSDKGKESINDGVKRREKAQKGRKEGKG